MKRALRIDVKKHINTWRLREYNNIIPSLNLNIGYYSIVSEIQQVLDWYTTIVSTLIFIVSSCHIGF